MDRKSVTKKRESLGNLLVYATESGLKKKIHGDRPDVLSDGEQRIVDSYKIFLNKLAYNKNSKFRHVGQRCDELSKWARTFLTGWPFKNNERLRRLGREQLVRCAEMYEKRLRDLYKAKKGRDIGKIEN